MRTETTSHFTRHLHWEGNKETRVYRLNYCMGILELIARLKDYRLALKNDCYRNYGVNANGQLLSTNYEKEKYKHYSAMIERLEGYYNLNLTRLQKF